MPCGSDDFSAARASATAKIAACSERAAPGHDVVAAERIHYIPAEAREVFDVSGAGDTVIATVAAGLPPPRCSMPCALRMSR